MATPTIFELVTNFNRRFLRQPEESETGDITDDELDELAPVPGQEQRQDENEIINRSLGPVAGASQGDVRKEEEEAFQRGFNRGRPANRRQVPKPRPGGVVPPASTGKRG